MRAHHGSIAREQRLQIEEELKAGRLPALVATSSLELGIDMGAIDLVVQIEAPPSVASGMQRIGRAGHQVGEPSVGKIFPKYRGDLLEAAVVVERMQAAAIEETRIPRNPLDVLAQQLVAICADRPLDRRRPASARDARGQLPRPLARAAGGRARHALRPLSVRRVRRPEAARRLGPPDRRGRQPQRRAGRRRSRAAARSRTAGCSASSCPATTPGAAAAGRRARRGDGVRVAGGGDLPARRLDLADRGDPAGPGDRDAGSGRAGQDAVLARRRGRAGRSSSGARSVRSCARWSR